MDRVPNKNIASVYFYHAVFSLLDLLTLEVGTDRLSQNIDAELNQSALHNIAEEHRSHMIWRCRCWFGFTLSGSE
jgi:hypothetical protein